MKLLRFILVNKTDIIIMMSLLLMVWGCSAAQPGTLSSTPLDIGGQRGPQSGPGWTGVGPPPKGLKYTVSHNSSDSNKPKLMDEMDSQDDTSNLKWVSIKNKQIPNDAVGIFNDYTSRRDFVCRAKDYCTFGFINEGRGLLCFFPFRGYELHTDNFDVLVNKDNFELLEWKSGSTVSDPDIKFCQDNFVGKNEYGLGDVFKGYFYLPWQGKEIWYSSYDVLSINHDIFDVHYSGVTYAIDQANHTRHSPYTIKTSNVTNLGDQEVTETVHMKVTTAVVNSWQSSFSSSLAQSTTIAVGVPDIASAHISIGAEVTLTLSDGHLDSESITQAQEVQVRVPPGHFCVVRMEGRKVEATIPYQGRVTKIYKNGKKLSTAVTGTYSGFQTAEISSEVDQCVPVTTPAPALKLPASSGTSVSVWPMSLLGFGFGLVILVSLLAFGALYSVRKYPFSIQKKHFFPLREEPV